MHWLQSFGTKKAFLISSLETSLNLPLPRSIRSVVNPYRASLGVSANTFPSAVSTYLSMAQDVLVLDQPLPTTADLEEIVRETFDAAGIGQASDADLGRAVDAMIGLSTFPAEQVLAMSLTKNGLAFDDFGNESDK